jgi:hypothetical protein
VKCPACGFDTPEEQGYCDFCKEPFRIKKPAPQSKPEPARPAPAAPRKVDVPKEVLLKLQEVRVAEIKGSAGSAEIPPEFSGLDTGGSIPVLSPIVKKAAWAFLAVCVLWIFILSALVLIHKRRGSPQ